MTVSLLYTRGGAGERIAGRDAGRERRVVAEGRRERESSTWEREREERDGKGEMSGESQSWEHARSGIYELPLLAEKGM